MASVRIRLFGSLRVTCAGQAVTTINTSRLHSLLAWLILHGGAAQPRERLAFLLWPESGESQARTNLRQLLHHLKRAMPPECTALATDHFTVQWRRDESCEVDAVLFSEAMAGAAAARAERDRERERKCLTAAAELYEDDLLPALYDEWLVPVREQYRRHLAEALHGLATLLEERREYAAAIPYAERLAAQDALCEVHYQLLIRLHAANHDRASALRTYHQCMRVLRREMGVGPGPATVDLFERVLKASPVLTAAPPAPRRQPAGQARAIVGRGREMERLAAAWQEVVEGGTRVVVISGEAGIGKTRLAEELYDLCAARAHAAARSRCYAGQGQVPYAPVAEWLRSEAVRINWPAMTPPHLMELARLAPEIRDQYPRAEPARPLSESWHRLHFHEALNAVFAICRRPLLLFLDDLQWCDPDSFGWLHALLLSPAARGTLLVGTARSEETGPEHPFRRFLAGMRQTGLALEVPLAPLDADATAELARQEAGAPLDNGNVDEIFRATMGNPLFVLESVRAGLQSRGIHAVIASRLARLSAASRELAGLASVVGRPFSFELLEKATDWDERSVSEALDELWRWRIIESRGAAEYDFTHDRLREVAYGGLSLVRERYWHRRVARALSEVYGGDPETWSGQIASHYEQAGMAEGAMKHYTLAAVSARRRYAHAEAADLLRRALALCRSLPESARRLEQELELLVHLGPTLVATEGYSAAEVGATYERALELSRRLEDEHIFAILSGAWGFHVVRGELEQSRQVALEFLERARRAPTPTLMLEGNSILGSSLFHLGRLETSLEHIRAAIEARGGPGESVLTMFAGPDPGVFCRSYLAHLTWHRGEADAESHMHEAMASAARMRDPFSQAIAFDYRAMLHVFRGEAEAALEHGRKAVELCARHRFAYYLAMANVLTGWALAAHGDVMEGLLQLRRGMQQMHDLSARLRLPYYFALLAETYGRTGRFAEALASISTGFALVGRNGEEWAAAELHRVQGDLLASQGKGEAARASYRLAAEAARRCGSAGFGRKAAAAFAPERAQAASQNASRTPQRAK